MNLIIPNNKLRQVNFNFGYARISVCSDLRAKET